MDRKDLLAYVLGGVGAAQMLVAGWWGAWVAQNTPGHGGEYPTMLAVQGGVCLFVASMAWLWWSA